MYPWRRVLIPTDFSTAARWAFDNAIHVAGSTGAELLVAHIRMTRRSHPDELRFAADKSVYDYAEHYELELLRDRARDLNASVATRLLVRQGSDPGNEICSIVKDENVDLIVIATHARHHVAHLLIGSTTMSVISNPPMPVLAVRYGTKRRRAMKRLVVPVHLKQASSATVTLAAAIAEHEAGEVRLIIVCDRPDVRAAHEHIAAVGDHALERVKHEQIVIESDDVEGSIVRYAEKSDADAIVVHTTIGDVKHGIIRNAETPTLIVPPAR
jgi:nucleotide-binding universal stress UspA family protein